MRASREPPSGPLGSITSLLNGSKHEHFRSNLSAQVGIYSYKIVFVEITHRKWGHCTCTGQPEAEARAARAVDSVHRHCAHDKRAELRKPPRDVRRTTDPCDGAAFLCRAPKATHRQGHHHCVRGRTWVCGLILSGTHVAQWLIERKLLVRVHPRSCSLRWLYLTSAIWRNCAHHLANKIDYHFYLILISTFDVFSTNSSLVFGDISELALTFLMQSHLLCLQYFLLSNISCNYQLK